MTELLVDRGKTVPQYLYQGTDNHKPINWLIVIELDVCEAI